MSGSIHPNRRENGQSLIEFAFMLVILLLLVAGVVDGTRALFTYMSMRDAAQEGALYASIRPTEFTASTTDHTGNVEQRICESSDLMTSLCDANSIDIDVHETVSSKFCRGTTSGTPHGMEVIIDYPSFPLTMPFIGVFVGGQSVPITVEVIDTIVQPTCP